MGPIERIIAPAQTPPPQASRILTAGAADRQQRQHASPEHPREPKDVVELTDDGSPDPTTPGPDGQTDEAEGGHIDLSA